MSGLCRKGLTLRLHGEGPQSAMVITADIHHLGGSNSVTVDPLRGEARLHPQPVTSRHDRQRLPLAPIHPIHPSHSNPFRIMTRHSPRLLEYRTQIDFHGARVAQEVAEAEAIADSSSSRATLLPTAMVHFRDELQWLPTLYNDHSIASSAPTLPLLSSFHSHTLYGWTNFSCVW